MEIHQPRPLAHSWGELTRELAVITAGVLIALAFDGIVRWVDHRRLVSEALGNIHSELADNVRELEGLFTAIVKERRNLEHASDLAQMLLDQRRVENMTLSLEFHGAELKEASRTTAEVTGAFGYMDYAEVERIAAVYGLQNAFNRAQERANQNFVEALAGVRLLSSPDKADPAQVRVWQGQIALTMASLTIEEQIGQQLLKRYSSALEAP